MLPPICPILVTVGRGPSPCTRCQNLARPRGQSFNHRVLPPNKNSVSLPCCQMKQPGTPGILTASKQWVASRGHCAATSPIWVVPLKKGGSPSQGVCGWWYYSSQLLYMFNGGSQAAALARCTFILLWRGWLWLRNSTRMLWNLT